jgi:hypothetical protein
MSELLDVPASEGQPETEELVNMVKHQRYYVDSFTAREEYDLGEAEIIHGLSALRQTEPLIAFLEEWIGKIEARKPGPDPIGPLHGAGMATAYTGMVKMFHERLAALRSASPAQAPEETA